MSALTKTQIQTAAESRENWWPPGESTSRPPDGLSFCAGSRVLAEVLYSLEKPAECEDHQLLPVGYGDTYLAAGSRGVGGVRVGERSGDCRGLCTCELGDGNSQWVMNMSSWQRNSPRDSPVREWELSNFNVGQVFYDTLRTRCHKAHKSKQLLETETVRGSDALISEQLRWHWIFPCVHGLCLRQQRNHSLLMGQKNKCHFWGINLVTLEFYRNR